MHRRVVNTRAPHQAAALDELLRSHGAVPLAYPCIDILPVDDDPVFDAALRHLVAGHYHWLVLTSPNTVMAVAGRLDALNLNLAGAPFQSAAIGPATLAAAHHQLGITTLLVPEQFVAESLGASLPVRAGERVLLPESDLARPVLAAMLRERGAEVMVVAAYRTVCGTGGVDMPHLLADGQVDALAFTSPSTVTNFIERVRRERGSLERALGVCAACIGPVTAEAARNHGFTNVLMPAEYTLAGLTETMEEFFCDQVAREDRS
jgi:uroporphyrinogen-III synthase